MVEGSLSIAMAARPGLFLSSLEAYSNRQLFLEAYQNALQAASDDGADDPAKRVLASWRGRDPYYVFRSPTEAKDRMPEILTNLTERNRRDVVETTGLYNFYTQLITPAKKRKGKNSAGKKLAALRGVTLL